MNAMKRGRPRKAEVDAAIHLAALDSLVESGYAGTSIERIALRAGVTRPTIYRRYTSKAELLSAAIAAAFDGANPIVPKTGNAAEDVRILLSNAIQMLRNTPIGGVVREIVPELARDADLRRLARRLLSRRRQFPREAIERGIERREFGKTLDVELTIDALLGAIYLRLLFTGQPIPNRLAADLVREFLSGR